MQRLSTNQCIGNWLVFFIKVCIWSELHTKVCVLYIQRQCMVCIDNIALYDIHISVRKTNYISVILKIPKWPFPHQNCQLDIAFNSMGPGDTCMHHLTGSPLVQVMAVVCPMSFDYLNQCWIIVIWTPRNKHQWNFNRRANIFIE